MYIKLKLEAKNLSKSESKKDSTFIHFPDSAIIRDLKERIEDTVFIYADEQIIKNVTETLHDHQKLCDVYDLENNEGSSLMLFNENEEFVCFLQLYNDEQAEKQRQFEEESKDPSYFKNIPSSSTSSVTLIEDSDPGNSSSEDTDSSEESETSTDSDEEANDAKEITRKRSSKEDRSSVPAKKRLYSCHSEIISKYLDELPTYAEGAITSTTPTNETEFTLKAPERTSTPNSKKTIEPSKSEAASNAVNRSRASPGSDSTIKNTHSSTATTTGRRPCASIAPEMRKFIAIVATTDCQEFLKTSSIEFERSNSASKLQFDKKMPLVSHGDGNLWIAASNDYTLKWILENIKSPSCDIKTLSEHFEYRAYSVVIPKFQARSKSLHEQFQLLEHQNADLNTEKWIVERQHVIGDENDEFFQRNVSVLCENEVIFLQVDLESEKYLKSMDFQLNYCFWKILFEIRKDD